MITIILLAIGGAVLSAIIGTVWYSSATPMGKLHMKYLGFDKLSPEEQKAMMEKGKSMMPKMYIGQMILSFLTSFAVVLIMIMTVSNGVSAWMALGFVVFNWLCFMVPIIGSALIWGNCDRSIVWKKFFSEIAANLVTVLAVAGLAVLFV